MLMCKVAYWILVVTHNPSKALTLQTILLGRPTAFIVKLLVQHWSSDDHRSHSYFLIKLAKLWWACWVGSESGEVGGASVCKDMKLFSVVLMRWFKTSYSAKYLNFTSLLLKYILFVLVMHPNPCILRDSSSAQIQMNIGASRSWCDGWLAERCSALLWYAAEDTLSVREPLPVHHASGCFNRAGFCSKQRTTFWK